MNRINEEKAKELAVAYAKLYRPSYYTEPFEPDTWVVQAIMEAYRQGWRHSGGVAQ